MDGQEDRKRETGSKRGRERARLGCSFAGRRGNEERGMAIDRAIVSFYDERENEANKSFGENGTGNSFVCLLSFAALFFPFLPSFSFSISFPHSPPHPPAEPGPDTWPRP